MSARDMIRAAALAAVIVALVAVAIRALRAPAREPIRASLALAEVMAADDGDYARALVPRPFVFPADHGPHPAFATEWWYFTGNVTATDGRRFGYQLTFFRKALAAGAPPRASGWAASQAYMAHFALTDVDAGAFHAFDRFARGAAGLAGADTQPFRVWLHDWRAEGSGVEPFPLRLAGADGDVAIDFVLGRGKPPVLQGDGGLSAKGPESGNASHYYSLTRMPTRGTVRVGASSFDVEGASWMDREWSTSALSPDLAGWDWFALQLSDGTEVMLYRLRREDGGASPFSAGSAVAADGTARTLPAADVALEVLDRWSSPRDGTRYPAAWRIAIPSERLELTVTPLVADQELNLAVRYWEGAVRVQGSRGGRPVDGVGYVELTGYAADAARGPGGLGR